MAELMKKSGPEMILVFEWDGKTVHKETKGFVGTDCVTKTKFIEDALGKGGSRKYKTEYHDESTNQESKRVRL